MKKVLIFLIICLIEFSCKKSPDLNLDQISIGDCKPNQSRKEIIKYRTVDNNYLSFTHINSIFYCNPLMAIVNFKIQNDSIVINEESKEDNMYCACPRDVSFRIGPLNYGVNNFILVRKGDFQRVFSINFNSSTNDSLLIRYIYIGP